MDRRRLLLARIKKGEEPYPTLPNGYTPLKAIKTDGNAYLNLYANTGYNDSNYITLTPPYRIEINNVKVEKQSSIEGCLLLGNFLEDYTNLKLYGSILAYFTTTDTPDIRVFNNSAGWIIHPLGNIEYGNQTQIIISAETSKTTCKVNTTQTETANVINLPFKKLFMFGENNGTLSNCGVNTEIGRTKIYQGETKLYDLIPCQNDNGTVCMWNAVSGIFYTNANSSGTFTAIPFEE